MSLMNRSWATYINSTAQGVSTARQDVKQQMNRRARIDSKHIIESELSEMVAEKMSELETIRAHEAKLDSLVETQTTEMAQFAGRLEALYGICDCCPSSL